MERRPLLLVLCLVLSCCGLFGQTHNLPEPMAALSDDGVTPPPGLELPIDDYLPFLLVFGLFFGAWNVYRIKRA